MERSRQGGTTFRARTDRKSTDDDNILPGQPSGPWVDRQQGRKRRYIPVLREAGTLLVGHPGKPPYLLPAVTHTLRDLVL